MRLPPRPDLIWKPDGTPVDPRVDDVYYSVQDGLAETRAVFLAGCGLPDAWQTRSSYTIAELGFGTGLNFLATWQAWQATRSDTGWLNFVSFEGFPLDADDIRQAMRPWPELAEFAEQLCAAWPPRAKGVRQLMWPEARLTLTLHIGLIEETLQRVRFKADAWFLDGFSPAKNDAMWAEPLWPLMAERSAPGARVGTFTVAGAVRRGLASAGFRVEKKPGHGRKRERLEAVFDRPGAGPEPSCTEPPRVAILGAGIAGACLARRLNDRGADVTVFDPATGPAQGTSGNPLALVMPRLDATDSAQARLLIDAYLNALSFYQDRPGIIPASTVQRPRDHADADRFAKVLADPPLALDQLEALSGPGLLHKGSLIVRPAELLAGLLEGVHVRWGKRPEIDLDTREISGTSFDAIVFANGWHMRSHFPEFDLTGRQGQVDWFESDAPGPDSALASGHYCLTTGLTRLWGATYSDPGDTGPVTSAAAQAENAQGLDALAPYWRGEAKRAKIQSRAGIRATTADRLPLIGAVPDADALAQDRPHLERAAWRIAPEAYARPGLFVAGGFGSRGFTWAPWAASILTAAIFNDPDPATTETQRAIVPNRQILRRLKRRNTSCD